MRSSWPAREVSTLPKFQSQSRRKTNNCPLQEEVRLYSIWWLRWQRKKRIRTKEGRKLASKSKKSAISKVRECLRSPTPTSTSSWLPSGKCQATSNWIEQQSDIHAQQSRTVPRSKGTFNAQTWDLSALITMQIQISCSISLLEHYLRLTSSTLWGSKSIA